MYSKYVNRGVSGIAINNRIVQPGDEIELDDATAESFNAWAHDNVFVKKEVKHGVRKNHEADPPLADND